MEEEKISRSGFLVKEDDKTHMPKNNKSDVLSGTINNGRLRIGLKGEGDPSDQLFHTHTKMWSLVCVCVYRWSLYQI